MKGVLRRLALFGSVFVLALPGAVQAATVTQCGSSICYVYDDSQAAVADFGLPALAGDSLFFTPTNFEALSINGSGLDTDSASFFFDKVYSHDGSEVEGTGADIVWLGVSESGDYRIIGGDYVDAMLDIEAENLSAETTSTTESFFSNTDTGGAKVNWSINAELYPDAAFLQPANILSLTVANELNASTDAGGELANIEKKFVLTASTVGPTSVVPVPAALWLFASALGLMGWLRRSS